MSAPEWTPAVGDGATVCHYTDRTACTIIRVSASGKTIWLREDTATRDDWKPEFQPGGFAGHCSNNCSQRYTYALNDNGREHRASLRKDGWYRTTNNESVKPGRHQFYDFDF